MHANLIVEMGHKYSTMPITEHKKGFSQLLSNNPKSKIQNRKW
jgi:hypothetical protein